MRTRYAEPALFPHVNLTAAEIARDLGYSHLYNILSPLIRHNVPSKALEVLQNRFHELIRDQLGHEVTSEHLYLPELVPLTELEIPEMWFPLRSNSQTLRVRDLALHFVSLLTESQGYMYRLDGRQLVVKSYGISTPTSTQAYRITEQDAQEIEDAIVFIS